MPYLSLCLGIHTSTKRIYIYIYTHTCINIICRHTHTQAYPHVWTSDSRGMYLQTSDCSVCTCRPKLPQFAGRSSQGHWGRPILGTPYSRNLGLWLKDTHLSCQNFLKNAPYQSPSVNSQFSLTGAFPANLKSNTVLGTNSRGPKQSIQITYSMNVKWKWSRLVMCLEALCDLGL